MRKVTKPEAMKLIKNGDTVVAVPNFLNGMAIPLRTLEYVKTWCRKGYTLMTDAPQ